MGCMDEPRATIERNVRSVLDRIARSAERVGRLPDTVRVIPITKSVGLDAIRILYDLSFRDVGENRVESVVEKRPALPSLHWHMVGSLQRRKVAQALDVFDSIDSVDRVALAQRIDDRASQLGRIVPVLLEVNVSGEATKHGFTPAELEEATRVIRAMPHLRVEGLMTMAPFVANPEETRPVFRELRRWAERLDLRELSMGMSNDFEVAVEEGSTQVRIGTALFE